jgi:SH3 domain-containing YSC84-like protein 1
MRTRPHLLRRIVKTTTGVFLSGLLLWTAVYASDAGDRRKQEEGLQNAGTVINEVLGMPDNLPQNLLDREKCVVVIPSVLKAAFILGGTYGRGAMVCRSGEGFTGAWGAPVVMAWKGAA